MCHTAITFAKTSPPHLALGMPAVLILSQAYYQPGDLYPGCMLDLERSFGFLVNDVARLFGRRFERNGRRLGLTRAQCRTLGYLARNEGINQAGLAELLEIRPMTLVRQIDRMEDAGWIERRPDPSDRRARRLYLTAKAPPILARIWRVATETRNEALAGLEPHEADQLIDLLHRVHATLGERLPGDGAVRPAMASAPRRSGRAVQAPERSEALAAALPVAEVGP